MVEKVIAGIYLVNKNMSYLKKILLISLLAINFLLPVAVLADNYGLDTAAAPAGLNDKNVFGGVDTPAALIGKIINYALGFVGLIFFILVLYAGLNWMTARGDSGKVDKSKDTLESALIGLAVIIAAYAIVNTVFKALKP